MPVRDSLIIDAVTKDYFAWKDVGIDDAYFVQLHYVDRKLEELYYITLSKSLIRELTGDFIYLGSKHNKKARVDYYIGSYLSLEVWNFEKQATELRYKLNSEEIENDSEIITPVDSETAVIEDKETGEFTKVTIDGDELDCKAIKR